MLKAFTQIELEKLEQKLDRNLGSKCESFLEAQGLFGKKKAQKQVSKNTSQKNNELRNCDGSNQVKSNY